MGYESQDIEITEANVTIDVALVTESIIFNEVVVSASRVEENIMQSPVSIEKIGIQEIRTSAAPDFYDEINNMKGVIRTQASLTFNTINTRGFATAGNTRFVQLQDGIDNAAPLLNFPTGNVVGISELDIKNVELVPGAASALYGPNAFNGILFMNSKEPWNYQGLSAQVKTGVTEGRDESNLLQGYSLRWADVINDKFAYKFNVSTFFATDWAADDYDTHIVTYDNSVSPSDQDFDGVNLYGDETLIGGGLTGLPFDIRRTGFREDILLDNRDAKSIKVDGALHYRINDDIEANVSYRYGSGSSVYQGAERYALRDFIQQFAKIELNGANWNLRGYGSFTDDGDSYNMSALGAFTNEGLFPSFYPTGIPIPSLANGGWVPTYVAAYSGAFNVFGVPAGNASAAREFADKGGFTSLGEIAQGLFVQNLLGMGLSQDLAQTALAAFSGIPIIDQNGNLTQETFNEIENVRNGLFQRGGAGFIDNSRMYHYEGNYDFTEALNNAFSLQVGANTRRYNLFTDGTIFREFNFETGENERIVIDEWGAYLQASKSVLDDKLKLTTSIRYDKNENFDGQFSPRFSAVYSIGEAKKHNIRTSFQTGFRNPTTQGQYIFFPASQILLGGTKANADIINELDGSIFNIFEDGALSLDGSTTVDLDYVKPERLTSFEIGYKGILGDDFFLDVNYYRNNYKDFINQVSVRSTKDLQYRGFTYAAGSTWFPYTNVPAEFSSQGLDMGFRYRMSKAWSLNGNYSYASLDFDSDDLIGTSFEGSNFDPGFNTPENKFTIGIAGRNIINNLSLNAAFRYQDEFFYSSSFGQGTIPSYQTLDAALAYRVPSMKTTFKLGATNLLKEEYVTNVGNPIIGRTIVLTITYDQFSN